MTKSLREQLADLRRFAKAHPEVLTQVRLVNCNCTARELEKHPNSQPVRNLLDAQLRILHQQILRLMEN